MWTPCWCPWRTVCDATRGAVAISMTCSTLVHPKTWRSDPHREGYCSRCSVCRSDNPRSQDESIPIEVVMVQVFPRELIVIFTSNISFNILSKWFLDFWSEITKISLGGRITSVLSTLGNRTIVKLRFKLSLKFGYLTVCDNWEEILSRIFQVTNSSYFVNECKRYCTKPSPT